MRCLMTLFLIVTAAPGFALDDVRWPDLGIEIPPRVQTFILAECIETGGTVEETKDECIRAERFGYRAVVTMLKEEETALKSAERYRTCSGGLGSIGGKFHRRKAYCIGKPQGIEWRFEYTQKAALEPGTRNPDARGTAPMTTGPAPAETEIALSFPVRGAERMADGGGPLARLPAP